MKIDLSKCVVMWQQVKLKLIVLVNMGVLYLLAVTIAGTIGTTGCSTARKRYKANTVRSLLKYRDNETARLFKRTHRSGNLYINFRPALELDAVFMDRRLREVTVKRYVDNFLLSKKQSDVLHAEQVKAFDNIIEMLVFVYEGNNKRSNLTNDDSPWRILLRDDDGRLHPPTEIKQLKKNSSQYQLLEKNFTVLDRWTQVYQITFTKLAKGVLSQQLGDQPFELIFTGIKGSVTLSWKDLSLFYRLDGSNSKT